MSVDEMCCVIFVKHRCLLKVLPSAAERRPRNYRLLRRHYGDRADPQLQRLTCLVDSNGLG